MRLITTVVLGLLAAPVAAQLSGVYEFDGGGDGTSWEQAANWEQVLDPFGAPISGDPASSPSSVISAEISLFGVVIDMPGQTALDIRIGTANGAGSLTISAGELTLRDMDVGLAANMGTLGVSGGTVAAGDDVTVGSMGIMTMSNGALSTGDDFLVNDSGSFTMTGGMLSVGDRLTTTGDATLFLDGGDITIGDDFFAFGDSQVTVNSGTIVVSDKLRFDDDLLANGKLTINSGIVRSNEFGFVDGMDDYILRGTVEINGDGVYQVEAPSALDSPDSQLTVAAALALIGGGVHFITSEMATRELVASSVVVPLFSGRTDVMFTQIFLQDRRVPEPATTALLALGLLGAGYARRRRAH